MKKVWIYRRKNVKGWWVAWVERGRQRAKCLPTKDLAEHFAHIKYYQLNSDVFTGTVNVPWAQLKAEYLKSKQVAGLRSASLVAINLTLAHFERLAAPLETQYISQQIIDDFVLKRAAELRSRHTLNKDIRNLKALLLWAADAKRRYLPAGLELRQVKAPARIVKPLNSSQVRDLLAVALAEAPAWYVRVLLAASTGLRKSDIERLTIGDIDFEQNTVDTHSRKTGKTMLFRPLPAAVVTELANYVQTLPAGQVKLFADAHSSKKWNRIRRRAELPKLRYQDLRVTFSSMLQQAGQPLSVAQRLLEHSSPAITEKFYTNIDPVLRTAVNSLPVDDWL